jgi:hypothetical protein
VNEDLICQKIKCDDLSDDGEPAWCYQAGYSAIVAAGKCPKALGVKQIAPEKPAKKGAKNE